MSVVGDWADIDVVLFDWNGTLIADGVRAWNSMDLVLEALELPRIDYEEFTASFRLPLHDWMSSLGVEQDRLAEAESQWNRHMAREPAELQPGARRLLNRLAAAGKTVGVVSAAATETVEADLTSLELGKVVPIVVGDAVDKVQALRDLVDGRRGVYVGDVEYDIEAGRQAGLKTVAFAGGYRPRSSLEASGADAVVDYLYEVAELIGLPSD